MATEVAGTVADVRGVAVKSPGGWAIAANPTYRTAPARSVENENQGLGGGSSRDMRIIRRTSTGPKQDLERGLEG
jgi:hypothetical protein